jgi:hypothetical protein
MNYLLAVVLRIAGLLVLFWNKPLAKRFGLFTAERHAITPLAFSTPKAAESLALREYSTRGKSPSCVYHSTSWALMPSAIG